MGVTSVAGFRSTRSTSSLIPSRKPAARFTPAKVNEDLTGSWLPKVLQRVGRQYPKVEVELEVGIGPSLFKMVATQELDLAVGGLCHGRAQGRRLWSEPLVWAFSADVAVPNVLPLAFFPEPCPYREAALRALAGSQKQWRIISTSASLAGVRAPALAGLAITPLPLQTLKPGLRILDKKDKMPRLPQVEYVLQSRDVDTQSTISALGTLIQEMAAQATMGGVVKKRPVPSTGATAR
jgi:DNA-binding transcriptional LysR family regulator